jgi:hypothetical protein
MIIVARTWLLSSLSKLNSRTSDRYFRQKVHRNGGEFRLKVINSATDMLRISIDNSVQLYPF